jgi:hypothetical protein
MCGDFSRASLGLLLLLAIARGIIYVLVIPPWQTPDEPSHFGYVRFVTENHCLPTFERIPVAEGIVASMSRHDFWKLRYHSLEPASLDEKTEFRIASRHPPLYYLLGTLLLIPLKGRDIIWQLYVLRVASVLMGTLTVLVAFRTTRMLFPGDPILPLTVGSFIAFLPMHTFISASVNNDNLAELLSAVIIYLLIRVLRDDISPLKGLGITVLLVAGYLTKRTTFFTIPLVLVTVPIYLCTRTYHIGESWLTTRRRVTGLMLKAWERRTVLVGGQALAKRIAIMTLIGLMCGAIGLVLIGQREFGGRHGDPGVQIKPTAQIELPLLAEQHGRAQPACLEITVPQILKFARISPARIEKALSPDARGASAMSSYVLFSLLTFASFWANFGWMNIPLDPVWYVILAVASLISALGLVLRVLREIGPSGGRTLLPERWQKGAFLVLLLASVLVFAQTFSLMVIRDAAGQGRYLFPAILPLSILFILGLRELTPSSYRYVFPLICIIGLFLFDTLCLTHYILPYFYG